jgi:phospholipid/cholesterol/gamma-HCH transport system substrate-binding protein
VVAEALELPRPAPGPPIVPVPPYVPDVPAVGPGCTAPATLPGAVPAADEPSAPFAPSVVEPPVIGAVPASPEPVPGSAPGVDNPLPAVAAALPEPTPTLVPGEVTPALLQGAVPGAVVSCAAANPVTVNDAVAIAARRMVRAFMGSPRWSWKMPSVLRAMPSACRQTPHGA